MMSRDGDGSTLAGPVNGAGDPTVAAEMARLVAAEQRLLRERQMLMATLSHDLKNPISVLQMHAYMMQSGSAREQQHGIAIRQASDRMLRLIDNLHDLIQAPGEGGRSASGSADLATVTAAAVADVEAALGAKALTIQTSLPADLPAVRGDAPRLQRALTNVLIYGIRRSPAGSPVTIIGSMEAPDRVRLDLTDAGPPAGPDQEAAVFDPYRQTLKDGAFTVGMGMAAGRRIVETRGGTLTLVEAAGGCVRLSLPTA
jgi:signal transduction histidine kinase